MQNCRKWRSVLTSGTARHWKRYATCLRGSKKKVHYEILFLDAEDSVLVKRYKETRRNHPLSGGDRVDKGIEEERKRLAFLKESADYIIDTSQLLTRELKAELDKIFVQNQDYKNLFITILSFDLSMGFRRTPIWSLTCVFCRIRIMWKDCGQRRAMTRRFRTMCSSMRRRIRFGQARGYAELPDSELYCRREEPACNLHWLHRRKAPVGHARQCAV